MSLTQPLVPVHDGRMKTIMNAEDLTCPSRKYNRATFLVILR